MHWTSMDILKLSAMKAALCLLLPSSLLSAFAILSLYNNDKLGPWMSVYGQKRVEVEGKSGSWNFTTTLPSTDSLSFENNGTIPQQDIDMMKKQYLTPPSAKDQLNLTRKEVWKGPLTSYVHRLLKGKKNGFFIEVGANDGEILSTTLSLELLSGWTGLLIEGLPGALKNLRQKGRNAWVAGCCLSPVPYATKRIMRGHKTYPAVGHIKEFFLGLGRNDNYHQGSEVQCYPLHYLLLAIGITNIDYFSVDVDGPELNILKTIPFDKISIKVISVEINKGDQSEITKLLEGHGYKMMKYTKEDYTHDAVYMKTENKLSDNTTTAWSKLVASNNGKPGHLTEQDLDTISDNHLKPPPFGPIEVATRIRKLAQNVWKSPVTEFVRNLLKNKTYGFFVEAWAYDGESFSNTLQLEVENIWTGLLVEVAPTRLKELLSKQRNAWVATCCLSSEESNATELANNPVVDKCLPLHSLLLAIGQLEVDYLSLGIPGVLETIPFDTLSVKVISVGTHSNKFDDDDDTTKVQNYLEKFGYKKMGFVQGDSEHAFSDTIFMKDEKSL
ncbi:Protein Star [Orchesella cincta]|uniref:Protein Star n=1 Tax=Orchesella cincta TaxID=48709 RepID=A0A1D2M8L9_ORCCI|nr:Protein Star [Orchesella cincta]